MSHTNKPFMVWETHRLTVAHPIHAKDACEAARVYVAKHVSLDGFAREAKQAVVIDLAWAAAYTANESGRVRVTIGLAVETASQA